MTKPVIVVLGAPNDDQGRLLATAEGRALAAVREYQRTGGASLLLTGGFGAHFNRTGQPHYTYVASFLEARGVPRSAILGGVASGNTFEDARMTAEFFAGREGIELRVVTSDFHAARARMLFERAFAGRAAVEMVVSRSEVSPHEMSALLRHEAEAVARLA